jgi:hypothetical protein
MKVNNEIARDLVAEIRSSIDDKRFTSDVLVSLRDRDGTRGAQIAAECLQRVLPNITADEHVQVATDVLRWYVDGDCLDGCGDVPHVDCKHC